MAKHVARASQDPQPVILLRERLRAARARGRPFHEVWPEAVAAIVREATPFEPERWAYALHSTTEAGRAGFERRRITRTDARDLLP